MGICHSKQDGSEPNLSNVHNEPAKSATSSANAMDKYPEDYKVGEELKRVPLLYRLTDQERAKLGGAMAERVYQSGDRIINEGDSGNEFFIIKKGTAKVSKDGNDLATLKVHDYFGEKALKANEPRNATITAASTVTVLTLDRKRFQEMFGDNKLDVQFVKRGAISAEQFSERAVGLQEARRAKDVVRDKSDSIQKLIARAVKDNILFANLESSQVSQIVEEMYKIDVAPGTDLIKQGDLGDNFYVVESGTFEIYVAKGSGKPKMVAQRGTGQSFGELALMYNSPRAATVRSVSNAIVWAVDRFSFRRILMKQSRDKIAQYEEFLKSVELLNPLLANERAAIAESLEEITFENGHVICRQGDQGDTFYIVKKGHCIVDKDGEQVHEYFEGGYFGERALLKDEPRAATIKADGKVQCLMLDRQAFEFLLGPLGDIMEKGLSRYDASQEDKSPEPKTHLEDIAREDLIEIGTLGKGSFGHVKLVKHRSTGKTYALKAVSKAQVVQLGQQDHIMSEKNVMAMLNHPTLIRLHNTYQTRDHLYFLLEVSLGGELFSVLRNRTVFDEDTARFFTACVVLAFEYMHNRKVIYRDLKPENLLLDARGYIKVTDFGFAKVVHDRTWTLCGTPDYLAPEVVSGQGHGKGVDWWTLGILVYEMLASYPPFYDEDPMKTYAKIMHGHVQFPKHFSPQSIDLIQKLLHPKATKRLGVVKGGADNIKKHPWFRDAGFDWDALEKGTMKAPIVPVIRSAEDLSNFEEYPEEHEEFQPYNDTGSGWSDGF